MATRLLKYRPPTNESVSAAPSSGVEGESGDAYWARMRVLHEKQKQEEEADRKAYEEFWYGPNSRFNPEYQKELGAVNEQDIKQRELNRIIREIGELEKPKFYNSPAGIGRESELVFSNVATGQPYSFSKQSGIYRTAPEQRDASGKVTHLGGFSNIGSVAGPPLADEEEGRVRLESLRKEGGLLGYKGAAETKENSYREKAIGKGIEIKEAELAKLKPDDFISADQYNAKVREIQSSIKADLETLEQLEKGRKAKLPTDSVISERQWGEERKAPAAPKTAPTGQAFTPKAGDAVREKGTGRIVGRWDGEKIVPIEQPEGKAPGPGYVGAVNQGSIEDLGTSKVPDSSVAIPIGIDGATGTIYVKDSRTGQWRRPQTREEEAAASTRAGTAARRGLAKGVTKGAEGFRKWVEERATANRG